MRYRSFVCGPWEKSGLVGRMVERALYAVIPHGNPDFKSAYEVVVLWWLEINEAGQVQREVGFDAAGQPMAIAPFRSNFGIFTDIEGHPEPLGSEVEKLAFEKAWESVSARFTPS